MNLQYIVKKEKIFALKQTKHDLKGRQELAVEEIKGKEALLLKYAYIYIFIFCRIKIYENMHVGITQFKVRWRTWGLIFHP